MSVFLAQASAEVAGLEQMNEPALIFTVLFCSIVFLIFMVMFSDKLFIETSSRFPLEVAGQSMVLAKLPFQVEFDHLEEANLSDGVRMKVNTEECIEVISYWGPSCALVIHALNNEATSLLTDNLDLEHIHKNCEQVNPGEEQRVHLVPTTSADGLDFGPLPRLKYPLVIIARCLDLIDSSQENHIAAGVWVIHVPDSVFKQRGHVISHLIITSQGMVHNLQKMFMATDHSQDTNTPDDLSESYEPLPEVSPTPPSRREGGFSSLDDGEHDCTVCQSNPITRVILPCRHGCICESCFKLVNKCPMCRGPIVSHFSLFPGIQSGHYQESETRLVE